MWGSLHVRLLFKRGKKTVWNPTQAPTDSGAWIPGSNFDKIKQFDYIQWFILFYVLFSTGLQKCSVNDSSASFDISHLAWWRFVETMSISQLPHPSSTPGSSSGQDKSTTAWQSSALSFGLRKWTVAIIKKCVKIWSSTSKFLNWLCSMKW